MRLLPRSSLASLAALVALAAPACNSSAGGSTGTSPFCSAVTAYAARCNLTSTCDSEELTNCAAIGAAYSDGYVNAVSTCTSQGACGTAGQAATTACIQAAALASAPSATAEKLAQDYCTPCAGLLSVSACVAGFYSATPDGGAGGGVASIGDSLLELNDTTLAKIDSTCIPALTADAGLASCTFGFDTCEFGIVSASLPAQAACTATSDAGEPTGG